VFVGDRPDKDIAGAAGVGMLTVRVRTGEYEAAPDEPPAWRVADHATAAIQMLRAEIARQRVATTP